MKHRPTIWDVARYAGVSKTTVSRVLNGDIEHVRETTRQKVLAAIEALGYERNELARGLRTRSTQIIMLAIPDITNPFWPEVARGVQDRMEEEGYSVVFANSDWQGHREREFLRMARRQHFDGILINPIQVSQDDLLSTGIPTVILGLREAYTNFDMVGSDTVGATISALEYLASLGHEHIGLLLGKHANRISTSRLDGYKQFLRSQGLPFDPALVIEVPFSQAGGREGVRRLLDLSPRPTAVLAANDIIAIGVLQALHEANIRVPEEISVMGMDDIPAAAMTIPPLTTIAKQKYRLGYRAASLLLERIGAGSGLISRREVIPCNIIIRKSTGPVRYR